MIEQEEVNEKILKQPDQMTQLGQEHRSDMRLMIMRDGKTQLTPAPNHQDT